MSNCPFSNQPCDQDKNHALPKLGGGEVKCCSACLVKGALDMFYALDVLNSVLAHVDPIVKIPVNKQKDDQLNITVQSKPIKTCKCGTDLLFISQKHRLGCPECYVTFKDELNTLITGVQGGANKHVGKVPKNSVHSLKIQLADAIQKENYEEAAKLRDEINVKTSTQQTS